MPSEQYKQLNCYQVLRIPHNATPSEIRSAYKQASLQSHPDTGGSHEAQVRVNLAYEILSNPIERQAHDIYWRVTSTSSSARAQSFKTSGRPTQTRPQTHPAQRRPPRREPLAGLKNRIHEQVEKEKAKIWQDLSNRSQKNENDFKQQFSNLRQGTFLIFVGSIALSAISIMIQNPWLWIGVAYLGWLLATRLDGVQIAGHSISLFDTNLGDRLRQYAQQAAQESCARDVNSLNRYISSLASLSELLLRSSTFDDSEEQIARRLAASFFLMGYTPIQYDKEDRLLRFTDGEETILVRFRHRAGIASDIVERKRVSLSSSINISPCGPL